MDVRYDVLAVSLATRKVRVLSHDKDGRNAEAIVAMAVARRGVKDEFFTTALHGTYRDGDQWGADATGATGATGATEEETHG